MIRYYVYLELPLIRIAQNSEDVLPSVSRKSNRPRGIEVVGMMLYNRLETGWWYVINNQLLSRQEVREDSLHRIS